MYTYVCIAYNTSMHVYMYVCIYICTYMSVSPNYIYLYLYIVCMSHGMHSWFTRILSATVESGNQPLNLIGLLTELGANNYLLYKLFMSLE